MTHELTTLTDDEGWGLAECSCGWISPPCPDTDTAAEFWADHIDDPLIKAIQDRRNDREFMDRLDRIMIEEKPILDALKRAEGS